MHFLGPYPKNSKNPGRTLSPTGAFAYHRAGDRARTGDPQLGKLMLYQLSYSRAADKCSEGRRVVNKKPGGPAKAEPPVSFFRFGSGQLTR